MLNYRKRERSNQAIFRSFFSSLLTKIDLNAASPPPLRCAIRLIEGMQLGHASTVTGAKFALWMDGQGTGFQYALTVDALRIVTVYSTEPEKGRGSGMLDTIVGVADAERVRLELCAYPIPRADGRRGLSQPELVEWYGRRGFVRFAPPNEIARSVPYPGTWMQRKPHSEA